MTLLNDNQDKWESVQGVVHSDDSALLSRSSGVVAQIQALSKEQADLMRKTQSVLGPGR